MDHALSTNILEWQKIGTNSRVLSWIQQGIEIPFVEEPRSCWLKNRSFTKKETEFLDTEIAKLLKNECIKKVTDDYDFPICISPITVCPKKNNKLDW